MRLVTNSNGSFGGPPSDSIGCHTQVFGVVLLQNKLYVASSCMEDGEILCYKQTVRNASGIAGDTCTRENAEKQHWWLRESPWSHFSWKSSVPCFADASSMSGRNRAGFKGKQVVVKLNSNNRLQRVQNLTLYSFVVQLLVIWEWSLRQVACWGSWTPSAYRRRKTERKSFNPQKLYRPIQGSKRFHWELWSRSETSGCWTSKWQDSSRGRWCVLYANSTDMKLTIQTL